MTADGRESETRQDSRNPKPLEDVFAPRGHLTNGRGHSRSADTRDKSHTMIGGQIPKGLRTGQQWESVLMRTGQGLGAKQ